MDRTCDLCDSVLTGRQTRFCSPRCRKRGHRKDPAGRQAEARYRKRIAAEKIERECGWCGQWALKTRANERQVVTCSQQCAGTLSALLRHGDRCDLNWQECDRCGRQHCRPAKSGVTPKSCPRCRSRRRLSPLRAALECGDNLALTAAIRADSNLDEGGCWLWSRRIKDGYPQVRIAGKTYAVHRLALSARVGELGDQPAHHVCANTMCVNPDHLEPVSHVENVAEMLARTWMERRIRDLELALHEISPTHKLLEQVSLPQR